VMAIYTLIIDGLFAHKIMGEKRKHALKGRIWELNCGILGLALAISLQYVIVGMSCSSLRPRNTF
jgi:diacylglycerol diphosphate phosphatase / phosphatidate phosphatase